MHIIYCKIGFEETSFDADIEQGMTAKAFAANKGPVKRLDLVGESAGVLTTLDQGSV